MKTLYITNIPAPYRVDYFNLLSEDMELTVMYERKRARNRNEKWGQLESSDKYTVIYMPSLKIGEESSFSLFPIQYLAKNSFDVVIVGGYSSPTVMLAIMYMRLKKIKFAIACDGILPTVDNRAKKWLKTKLVSSAEFWLSSGQITSHQLEKYGANPKQIFIYPFSSVKEEDIVGYVKNKKEYKRKIGCKEEKMILYVGQMISRKGVDILVNAFIENFTNDCCLYLIGGIEQSADSNVKYVGFKTKEELTDYYQAADVFVLPTREDIWGLVVNEALAKGVPVITTERCGAGLEMIQSGVNGYIVPTENADELSARMKCILSMNDEEVNEMQMNAIATAHEYTVEKMANRTKEILFEMA